MDLKPLTSQQRMVQKNTNIIQDSVVVEINDYREYLENTNPDGLKYQIYACGFVLLLKAGIIDEKQYHDTDITGVHSIVLPGPLL